ncbi:MAG: carbon starvation protein A, partial [Laribacter sp.]|nr:carbon starvation protein A [Laribacter sp.]
MKSVKELLLWGGVGILGAFALATVALNRGESINAVWLVVAAVSCYFIAYRFYSRFIAATVTGLDARRRTPAEIHNDGMDYVPTPKWVLFGHHFAAIAGAGPLVGPVLAAQMGYLPGTLWIVFGVIFAGAVQDFIILFLSVRRDGKSLGEIIRMELGDTAGTVASIGILMIMVILLAVLALVVVKALAGSPWGTFTIAMTIPIAFFMGIYMRYIRPGKIAEISVIGFVLLMLSIVYGENVARSELLAPWFTLDGKALAWALMIYGFIAAVLPVWLLLAPRDYLSTFLKIGTIVGLALGIVIVAPHLQMPAVTQFIDGTGPVFAGNLFPFLFITIACGAISGFHSLVSSGTTPKMLDNEQNARLIGYGAMLMESFVAMMALIAASVLDPGVYFAMNAPAALIGKTAAEAAQVISGWGFVVTPEALEAMAADVGESSILSRAGGAPTLAVGMAYILHQVIGGQAMMAFWYHFAILFEALFILTTVDAGTRVCRFMIQDLLGSFIKPLGNTDSWPANLFATFLAVGGWGYFLYQGVVDPLGGINTLWPLFGIANQMLAGMALILATVVLVKLKKARYAWVTAVPCAWVLLTTLYAGWLKLFSPDPKISFVTHAQKFSTALAQGEILAPAKSVADMRQIIFNDWVDAALCGGFMLVVLMMLV